MGLVDTSQPTGPPLAQTTPTNVSWDAEVTIRWSDLAFVA